MRQWWLFHFKFVKPNTYTIDTCYNGPRQKIADWSYDQTFEGIFAAAGVLRKMKDKHGTMSCFKSAITSLTFSSCDDEIANV